MPLRDVPLVSNEYYHVFNRGHASSPVFLNKRHYEKFIDILLYYRNLLPPLRYSKFLQLDINERKALLEDLAIKKEFLIDIVAYCLMPNHFHLLVKQNVDSGIQRFLYLVSSSYSHYFNLKNNQKGSLFEGRFRAVHISNDDQLMHLSRYIHLNPYSSYVVRTIDETFSYPYSSLLEYIDGISVVANSAEIVLSQFKNLEKYKEFVLDRADYQRTLETIKHQTIE